MKKLIFIFLTLLFVHQVSAQKVRVGLDVGYGNYRLKDLKAFQAELAEMTPIESVQMVEQFPNYVNYGGSVEIYHPSIDILMIGLNVAYFSTGGRNHVKDYSGEYKLDMPLTGYRFSLQLRTLMAEKEKFQIYNRVRLGAMFSTLKFEESIIVYDEKPELPIYTFKSIGLFLEPSFGVSYELIKGIHVDFSIGYQIDMKAALYESDEPEFYLHNSNQEEVDIIWSGFRTYLGVAYDIF